MYVKRKTNSEIMPQSSTHKKFFQLLAMHNNKIKKKKSVERQDFQTPTPSRNFLSPIIDRDLKKTIKVPISTKLPKIKPSVSVLNNNMLNKIEFPINYYDDLQGYILPNQNCHYKNSETLKKSSDLTEKITFIQTFMKKEMEKAKTIGKRWLTHKSSKKKAVPKQIKPVIEVPELSGWQNDSCISNRSLIK